MTSPLSTALADDPLGPSGRWRLVAGARSTTPGHEAPPFRDDLVPRPRLVRRLAGDHLAPLVVLVAPAGYGKTTLMSEWAHRDARPFAWTSLRAEHDDPDRLAALIAAARDGLSASQPGVIVLDGADVLRSPQALAVVLATVDDLEPGSVLAMASRREPGLPLGRLRAQRMVTELSARDLAMNRVEAAMLLARAGVQAEAAQVLQLSEETEGWPVGLYLGALSLARHGDDHPAMFFGEDRLVADYLRDELLSGLSEEQLAFMRRTSVLERLSGPLCDAVLERQRSGTVLRDLARDNVLMEPLDSCDREFRFHPLLASMLRGELRRREHGAEAGLHRRASAWHEDHDDPDRAVGHAIASGDRERAGALMWDLAPGYAFGGATAVLAAWLASFSGAAIAASPRLALTAATLHFARGDRDCVEHWLRAAEAGPEPADGHADGLARAAAALRAALAPDFSAMPEGRDGGALHALGRLADGVGRHLAGDREAAAALLNEGARLGAVAVPVVRALCLAQLAILAAEADDWAEASMYTAQAAAQVQSAHAGDDPVVALVHALCAAVDAHRGHPERARHGTREVKRLLEASPGPVPWLAAEACIWLARAAIRLSDVTDARALLAQAARLRREVPDAEVLEHWIDDAWERADAFAAGATGVAPTLTMAELRVLRFLPSHLSFREIGDRLHVSANTVKTQALAVYRKLDVSSRSDAVVRGRAVGLLDG